MSKPGTSVVVALTLALAGCSSEVRKLREAIAPMLCKVADSDGHLYEGTNIEPLNALEEAMSRCALGARDPTACQEVACAPM